ncbi:MAG TPA: response regulator [Patescibacteria group bacterium]|nr:response regulator [Patescibacteria group bacterium]
MTFDALLTIALDVAFFAIFGFALLDYLRHRDRVRLVILLVFGSLTIVLAAAPVRAILPALGGIVAFLTLPALLAEPVLVLWLASFVRHIPRPALLASAAAFIGVTGGVIALAATNAIGSGGAGAAAERSPAVVAIVLALLAYFLVLEAAASISFALAARSRAGASRTRLATAALATGLFGAALVIILAAGVVFPQGSDAMAAVNIVIRVVALLSAVGYLAAFAPPRTLRKLSQQGIVYDFVRDLNLLPADAPVAQIWELLIKAARHASGASRVEVVLEGDTPAVGPDGRRVSFPFNSERWPEGRLEMDLPANFLFAEDDVELIGLLVDRAARSAEREAFVSEREKLIDELQAASAAKSDFLAAMSHELRTPLNAIIGFSELLAEGDGEEADPSTVRSYADHIHGSGLHLLELVNDVLDLARVEAGRLDLKPIQFPLHELVRQTASTMQPLADQKEQRLSLNLAEVNLEADPSRVRQIVLNLLSNAVKFTGPGGEIRVSVEQGPRDDVVITVTDTGHGIPATDLERIFEAFQQADPGDMKTRHEGTGLGLALTRQLVEAHHGRISVVSEVGVGSTFTVRLPLRRPIEVTEAPPVLPAGQASVLVIEDDPAAQELLRVHLEGAGYGVVATASGRQALAWLTRIRPDAVILDIMLPDLDGWEILQRLKANPATRSVPVMVVSIVDDRELGLALGAIDYLVKPVSRELLLEAIGRLTFTTKVRTRTVTVLVIDADRDALGRYRHALEPEGFRVIAALDGASGRQRAVDEKPDLILLDALLPDGDGFELTAELRRDPATATIPIWVTAPGGLAPDLKAQLNGNVQGVLVRGDDALSSLRGWLETGSRPGHGPVTRNPATA